jgi:anti-sigma regulatory factor (Ser/Thr protein kinase)
VSPMDEIVLTLPRERDFYRIAHLVLGGVAARRNLTYEHLEDLQLALETLLERRGSGDDITIRLSLNEDVIHAEVGPLDDAVVGELEPDAGSAMGIRRVLDTVTDEFTVGERPDGPWVSFSKGVGGG